MDCPNCKKVQVPPDERCDCRLEWQINKSFKMHEALKEIEKRLAPWTSCRDAWETSDEFNDEIALIVENALS